MTTSDALPTLNDRNRAILRAARDIIASRPLHKGGYTAKVGRLGFLTSDPNEAVDPTDSFCLAGAICVAARNRNADGDENIVGALGFKSFGDLTSYNDAPETTREDVLARIDKALAR